MGASFSVATRWHEHTARLVLRGQLDPSTVTRLYSSVDAALADQPLALIIDLGGLTFMDSAGLTALVDTSARADALAVLFEVQHVQPAQRRLFQITGLDVVFGTLEPDASQN